MTIRDVLDDIKIFIENKVACEFKLEKPPVEDLIDEEYTLVNPSVFIGWLPPKNYNEFHEIPSIIVMGDTGEDNGEEGSIGIRLAIGTYDIGHTIKTDDELNTSINSKGYLDLINLVEKIKQEFSKNRVLDHTTLEGPFKWGLYEEQPFPYWYAWVSFNANISSTITQYGEKFL
ncbi:hypothetical protein J2Z76_002719 [Sedimentibacter acidaminivorans]|uniref:Uncharacterized protein n=1 Tax=Sedimentibacter acidaminivorans TaxID=913099 RepID=A0ABS4GGM5_9FIRM|nr:hypothetical protein [Sedimentibacter acidaminivorans]MBP1926849.1 hypothetical protein [Sedimentibacter acidaminivorans]